MRAARRPAPTLLCSASQARVRARPAGKGSTLNKYRRLWYLNKFRRLYYTTLYYPTYPHPILASRVDAVRGFAARTAEGCFLLRTLAAHHLGRLAARCDEQTRGRLTALKLRDWACGGDGAGVAAQLISVLITEHMAGSSGARPRRCAPLRGARSPVSGRAAAGLSGSSIPGPRPQPPPQPSPSCTCARALLPTSCFALLKLEKSSPSCGKAGHARARLPAGERERAPANGLP